MGHVTDFKAVPGYGIECVVSNIGEMIENASREQIISQNDTEEGYAPIDGLNLSENQSVTCHGDIELQQNGEFSLSSVRL